MAAYGDGEAMAQISHLELGSHRELSHPQCRWELIQIGQKFQSVSMADWQLKRMARYGPGDIIIKVD